MLVPNFLRWLWYLLPLNPMIVRMVQGASRRTRDFLVRMGYLGVLTALMFIVLLSGGGMGDSLTMSDLAQAGQHVFRFVSFGQVILICLLAPMFMAEAIAQERSGETYNILLTTPLSNLQIVLGSLFGRLFFVLALLFSGLPLFAVLLIFGGVRIQSVFLAFATAALVALLVGSVAVTLSAMRAGGRKAVFVFIITIAAYLVAGYALDVAVLRNFSIGDDGTTWLTPLHPILVLEASIQQANYRPPSAEDLVGYPAWASFYLGRPFATFAVLSILISTILMLFSAVMLRQVGTGDSKLATWMRRWLRLAMPGQERYRKPREVWHNPIAWREASTRGNRAGGILARWGFLSLAVILTLVVLGVYHSGGMPPMGPGTTSLDTFQSVLITLLLAEVVVIVLVAIYMSAGCVSREREEGTLDLMLTTPITPKYYIWGKLRGLVSFLSLLLAAPILTLSLVSVYSLIGRAAGWPTANVSSQVFTGDRYSGGAPTPHPHQLLIEETPILLALILVPFVAFCTSLGMNWSLQRRTVLGAVIWPVAILAVLVGGLSLCGWYTVGSVEFFGTMINAFSPATGLFMLVDPWERIKNFAVFPGVGRIGMLVAAAIAAGAYSGLVYAMIIKMVSNFDQTVRKLSGTG